MRTLWSLRGTRIGMKKKFDILRWRDEDANESCTFQCSQGTSGHQPNDEIKSIYEHNGVLDKIHSAKHIGAPNVASGCHRSEHTVCALQREISRKRHSEYAAMSRRGSEHYRRPKRWRWLHKNSEKITNCFHVVHIFSTHHHLFFCDSRIFARKSRHRRHNISHRAPAHCATIDTVLQWIELTFPIHTMIMADWMHPTISVMYLYMNIWYAYISW